MASVLWCSGGASFARAEIPALPIDLDWTVPTGCPSRETILERVRRLAGDRATKASRIEARAKVTKANGTFVLVVTVRVENIDETRTTQSRMCGALGEAAALILATALDASREAHSHETVASDRAVSPDEVPAPQRQPDTPHRARTPERVRVPLNGPAAAKLSAGIGIASLFDFGTLPRPTPGLEGAAYVRWSRWRFGFAGSLWAAREQSFAERTRGGARFNVYTAGGFACWAPYGARFRVGPCVELDLTHLDVEGFGIRRPGSSAMSWPTLRLGGLGEASLTRTLSVFLRADVIYAFDVPRIVLTASGGDVSLFDVKIPALRVTIGARADFF